MSKSEMSAERREGRDPHESGDDSRDELKSILDTIAAQLLDADRRHTAALNEMQDRISGMGREADLLRVRIPDQFAPAFEQIEAGIGELAHRLVDAEHVGARGAARTGRQHRASARSGHADLNNPWDRDDAEALASVYEASAYPPSSASARDASESAGGTSNIDEAWLESRFAEIARGIEYSLAHMKPESKFPDFDQRFDQFERQFAKVFTGVATHDDLAAVQQIEAHMEEIVNRLEKTNDQLDRLNTIEAQLANVSQTLAEMQAANAKSADIGAVARAVAEETAQRFASRPPEERNSAADELRPLIEQLMTENRQGGEQTAMLLDTMQQAMVRLLDRVEAIDFPQPQPPPRIFEADHPADYGARTEMFGSDMLRDDDFAVVPPAFDEDDSHGAFPGGVSPPPLSAGSDTGMSPEEMALRSEKMRQEFIADARRAKMRLSSEGDDIDAPAPSLSATRTAYAAGSTPAGSRPIRPPSALSKNTSGPSAPSPRLMIVAGFVLVALAGLWYAFGFESRPRPAAVQESAPATTTQSKTAEPGNATGAGKSSGAPAASEPSSGSQAPSAPASEPNAQGGVNGPRGDLGPHDGGAPSTTASIDQASVPRTTLPMIGVAVDLNRPVTEAELIQARRHQAMANLSGELGSAAARPGESAVVPASMIPTEAETEGITPPAQNASIPIGAAKSSRLDMPPAMIGPLSLRLAAANGDSSAQFEVGARFAEGEGVPQNFAEAAKWYQRSAEQGFALAQYRLGTLYERGLGLKADRKQASTWYLRAAEQGNIKAMHNLAVLSANQSDRAPDYTTAAQWFEEAAKRGLPDSQFNLAVLYENGLGVTRDLRTAFMWLSLAAQGGDADAIRRRDILRGKLTAQDITVARRMISAWQMMPPDRLNNDALIAGDLWKKNPRNGVNG